MTVCSAPPSSGTPSTTSRSVPMPSMRAPIFPSSRQRSCTCGSRAALKISVLPSARTAASRMFSVPVTVGRSKTMRAPRKRSACATSSVADSEMVAPICRSPRRCCSTRRAPMSSPPGRGSRALPKRPSNAPKSRMVARIRLPRSSGTRGADAPRASIVIEPSPLHFAPMLSRTCAITRVSVTRGTFFRCTGSSVRRAAAISGRAAFLEPLTHRSPASGAPPVIFRTRSRSLPAACSREPQARLRDGQRLVELDLLRGGQRAGEPLLGALARRLGLLDRDLFGVLGHVGKHGDAVGQHFEEPAADEQELLLGALDDLQRARLEDRHERGVARQHAELAVGAVGDDEVHIALEQAALDADHPEGYWHLARAPKAAFVHKIMESRPNNPLLCTKLGMAHCCFFFIASAWARASSMVPTM